MASVNKIILLGTVTTAPDFRVLSGGSMMVSLQMETTVGEETESHDVTFYGRLAEIVMQYVAEQMFGRKKDIVSDTDDLFSKDNPYKKAREGRGDPPDLSRFEYDDW